MGHSAALVGLHEMVDLGIILPQISQITSLAYLPLWHCIGSATNTNPCFLLSTPRFDFPSRFFSIPYILSTTIISSRSLFI